MMRIIFNGIFLILFTFAFCSKEAKAQSQEPSYTLTFLKGKYIDSTNPSEIILVFRHAWKRNAIEKLIISGKLTYSLGTDGQVKTEVLGQGTNQHTITVFGHDVEQKDKYLYDLIKDAPDFSIDRDSRFIVFTLRNLTDKYVDNMSFTYGLWEPTGDKIRIESTYQITIDK